MTLEKHDLLHEFPEHRDLIHHLKISNGHFARLFEEYHELVHEIRRIELGVENPDDDYVVQQKKKRLQLKDELFDMIHAAVN